MPMVLMLIISSIFGDWCWCWWWKWFWSNPWKNVNCSVECHGFSLTVFNQSFCCILVQYLNSGRKYCFLCILFSALRGLRKAPGPLTGPLQAILYYASGTASNLPKPANILISTALQIIAHKYFIHFCHNTTPNHTTKITKHAVAGSPNLLKESTREKKKKRTTKQTRKVRFFPFFFKYYIFGKSQKFRFFVISGDREFLSSCQWVTCTKPPREIIKRR